MRLFWSLEFRYALITCVPYGLIRGVPYALITGVSCAIITGVPCLWRDEPLSWQDEHQITCQAFTRQANCQTSRGGRALRTP